MQNKKLIELLYAASVACSQALIAFAQVRAQQDAFNGLSDREAESLLVNGATQAPAATGARRPIGFVRE